MEKNIRETTLRKCFFVLLHPITQKALCATFSEDMRDWSNAAHEPTHSHLNGFVSDEISPMPQA
jgi:hypothetical protein